ncbi:MAG: adenylate/guanylate cyclase domain-containing protein [Planctomycetota bacterium]|nr:adenylate/guanylate cyclase domain-containing protein [Planctomycetota bacterium]
MANREAKATHDGAGGSGTGGASAHSNPKSGIANPKSFRPGLGLLFLASVLGLALLLGLLFALILHGSRQSTLELSARMREEVGRGVASRVRDYLGQAYEALQGVRTRIAKGLLEPRDTLALERDFYTQLVDNPNLAELTLTYGRQTGFDAGGALVLEQAGRGQVSVFRALVEGADAEAPPIYTRWIEEERGAFFTALRGRGPDDGYAAPTPRREGNLAGAPIPDPTGHPTFLGVTSADVYGQAFWSDLHRSQLDANLPEDRRRTVLTVQQVLEDAKGEFAGVLRVGFTTKQLDRIAAVRRADTGEADPHLIFLVNGYGGLVSRPAPQARMLETETDLRADERDAPEAVREALALWRSLGGHAPEPRSFSGTLETPGGRCLVTFRPLDEAGYFNAGAGDWSVGIAVAEEAYLGGLAAMQRSLALASALVMAAILLGGWWTLRLVRRDLSQVVDETARMRRFEFEPRAREVRLRDVGEVVEGLELAKTATRAMGKYVPVALVRQLYESGREPVLGGELRDLTILFSDIKDFTQVSERLAPDVLAQALGLYLQTLTEAVHAEGGVIDKYIGDAVMALWNAPDETPGHARSACAAALACARAAEALYASPAWRGLPVWTTRFGLHTGGAMVGHFGAPERMNYTALGDNVNLASRLEGLNKAYGTRIVVSEDVRQAAGEAFDFRLLDLVAVKGKSKALRVYELLGESAAVPQDRCAAARAYEAAFERYLARDFTAAQAACANLGADAPARVLAERCARFLATPPAADWDGVYVATTK